MAAEDMLKIMREMQQKSISEKKTKYSMLNKLAKKGQIVFVGSSLMEFFPIDEMQLTIQAEQGRDLIIYNRGLAGATTADLSDAMEECIFDLEPSKVFINIGSNDIGSVSGLYKQDKLLESYARIMDEIKRRLPLSEVYVMAYYPVNSKADFGLDKRQRDEMFATRTNDSIKQANIAIEEEAKKHGFSFIDVSKGLKDEQGELKKEYSIEGLHLWPNAYAVIFENLKKYL